MWDGVVEALTRNGCIVVWVVRAHQKIVCRTVCAGVLRELRPLIWSGMLFLRVFWILDDTCVESAEMFSHAWRESIILEKHLYESMQSLSTPASDSRLPFNNLHALFNPWRGGVEVWWSLLVNLFTVNSFTLKASWKLYFSWALFGVWCPALNLRPKSPVES